MQLITKVIIGIFIASFLQWLNYSFFIGFVIGTLSIIIIQYNFIMKYLQDKHKDYEISITSIQQHVEQFLHPIKVKPKHYINRFNMELQVQNPQPQNDKQWQLQQVTVIKLGRKKYLKRIETYQDFLDELKDAQQQHGQLLINLDSKLQIENELTQLHKYKEENSEVILNLTGVQMTNQMHILLPQWKDYKKVLKFFGHQHIDVAKAINHCVQEQIVTLLKKNYTKEMEEFRKQRRKLKTSTVECYQHYQKILNEYYQHEKELQTLTQAHAEMIKRKDDPTQIIKSEMKVKLQIQQQDNIRLKLTDSRDSLKENSLEVKEFNNKLSAMLKSYEEQRIVFTKQCFQNSLIGIEDMATKMQTLISSLIIILDQDNCQIFPQRVSKSPILSPQKSLQDIIQQPQINEMSLNDQIKECQRQTDYLLTQWNLVQKYNEEIEYFFKDLIVIFTPQTHEKDISTVRKQLESEKTIAGESLNIMVQSLLKGTQIFKDSIKLLVDQFERKRQEIAKCRLDMSIGRELEQRAILDLKKLQGLNTDERALEQYQSESKEGSKTKKAAQHFLSEMKQNFKDVSSLNLGKFAATVSQSVSKVSKMSNLKEDDLKEQQLKLNEDKKNLISLQGFTLKKLEDILNQHNKLISKMKKQLIDDLGTFSLTLHNHLRMIVDEMTENIQMIQQREQLVSQNDELIESEQQVEIVPTTEEIVEDLHVGTTSLLIQKLLKVFVNDWKESEYFKNKIKKLLQIKLNKKRANMLSEISVNDLIIIGDPPSLTNIQSLRQDINEFLCDFDLSFRGKVQLNMTTNILINWPKEYQVPVEVKATISTFTSRIRLCFVPSFLGKSWLSMIGQPVVNLDVEPTLLQKYNIAKIQQIADLIREFLIGKIKLMTYPNKLTIKIPLSKK